MRALKRTMTMSALDQSAYRDKLAAVSVEASTMHLSPSEVADRYGEVVAALVVLQPGDALPVGAVPGARVEALPPVLAEVLGGNLS